MKSKGCTNPTHTKQYVDGARERAEGDPYYDLQPLPCPQPYCEMVFREDVNPYYPPTMMQAMDPAWYRNLRWTDDGSVGQDKMPMTIRYVRVKDGRSQLYYWQRI